MSPLRHLLLRHLTSRTVRSSLQTRNFRGGFANLGKTDAGRDPIAAIASSDGSMARSLVAGATNARSSSPTNYPVLGSGACRSSRGSWTSPRDQPSGFLPGALGLPVSCWRPRHASSLPPKHRACGVFSPEQKCLQRLTHDFSIMMPEGRFKSCSKVGSAWEDPNPAMLAVCTAPCVLGHGRG